MILFLYFLLLLLVWRPLLKSKFWSTVFGIMALTVSLSAEAKPFLDDEVSLFLNTKNNKNQSLPVIITFQTTESFNELPHHPFNHAEVQRKMMTENQFKIDMLINQKNKKNIFNLWIAKSALTNVDRQELGELSNQSEISMITFAHKKIVMAPTKMRKPQVVQSLTYGLKNIKIPELRAKYPELTGRGMIVGVLDTGVTPTHPDLKGKILAYKNFSPNSDQNPIDDFGHGTHVTGTMVGGATSGLAIGVAPEAKVVVGKIFDVKGESTKEEILKAMQWIADPDGNPNTNDFPVVVNNSWGDDEPYRSRDPKEDEFCTVIDSWIKLGMVPVFTAGNNGPRDETINVPGACPNALTVGAVDQFDRNPRFSSSGPTSWKTIKTIKPDVVAPGVDVKSANQFGRYENMSGTSMAAPHVSGAMALIIQAKPELTVEEAIKSLIMGVQDFGRAGKDNTFGEGRIDLLKTIELIKKQ